MKTFGPALLLMLSACGAAASNKAADEGAAETIDAATAEAVRDTQAATNDAAAAANAELDRLEDRENDPGGKSNKANRVSNSTAVTVY